MNVYEIDWVVGAESGFKARVMQESWVWNIQKQCKEQGVAFSLNNGGLGGMMTLNATKKTMAQCLAVDYIREYPKLNSLNKILL